MNTISFQCPNCGQALEASSDMIGDGTECPKCGREITVPAPPALTHRQGNALPAVRNPWNVKIVAISFVAGALLAGVVVLCVVGGPPFSLQALPCTVLPNDFMTVSGFEVKILDANWKSLNPRLSKVRQPRMANLQWRCDVKNISTVAIRYQLKAELLDKDDFVLATTTLDSQEDFLPPIGQGDLSPAQTHKVNADVVLEYAKARNVASSRITLTALHAKRNAAHAEDNEDWAALAASVKPKPAKTDDVDAFLAATEDQTLERQREELKQQAVEKQRRIDEASAKWKELGQGMTKSEVENLLGKPDSVQSFGSAGDWWEYSAPGGGYSSWRVEFSEDGTVKGWKTSKY